MRALAKTHYESLGISRNSTQDEIRSAYRKLVLKHHPDHSTNPRSKEIFLEVTEAYQVLTDHERKTGYDAMLAGEQQREAEKKRALRIAEQARRDKEREMAAASAARSQHAGTATRTSPPRGDPATVMSDVAKLTILYSRGQFADCERLAQWVIERDPRQPMPYAVLGDIARSKRDINEAARLYSMALQMDPKNALYLRRYEELLGHSRMVETKKNAQLEPEEQRSFTLLVGGFVLLLGMIYVFWAKEPPIFATLGPISTWTLGLTVWLFVGGAVAGTCLSLSNMVERLDSLTDSSLGRRAPIVTLGLVAIFSFPVALGLYMLLGVWQKGFNFSTTRLLIAVSLVTFLFSGAAFFQGISFTQSLLWGGNLSYMGALCGWLISDSVRG